MSDSDTAPLVKSASGALAGKTPVKPPGPGQQPLRRRAAASQVTKPNSTRAAGAGGSSGTMLKLYSNEDSPGLRVDPFVVIILSLAFIASIFFLHISAKIIKAFTK